VAVNSQSYFCLLFNLITISDLVTMGAEVYKLAQVFDSNLISD